MFERVDRIGDAEAIRKVELLAGPADNVERNSPVVAEIQNAFLLSYGRSNSRQGSQDWMYSRSRRPP